MPATRADVISVVVGTVYQAPAPGELELVEPIITPRFAPACSDDVLRGMGEIAAVTGVRVQTHARQPMNGARPGPESTP